MTDDNAVTVNDLARIIIALRIANLLSTRALMSQGGNYPWEDLDEDESEALSILLLTLNDDWGRNAVDRAEAFILAIGQDEDRDDFLGDMVARLVVRLRNDDGDIDLSPPDD
jgi:hypothetical protein